MKKRKVKVTRVFDENEKAKELIVCNRGGARSSKSFSLGQLFVQRLTAQHKKTFLVVRKTMPSLRITAYKLILDLLADYGYLPYCRHNKTNNILEYGDNFMLFTSIEYVSRIKSTEWNYIWMEEAEEFTHDDFQILKMRLSGPTTAKEPNQMFLSFNPVDAYSWLKTEVIEKENSVRDIVSTYKDNPFLSPAYVKILEDLKNQDETLWQVYGLGEWGVLKDLIYTNWDVVREWPKKADYTLYGLDFGYNNPSAFIQVKIKDQEVWLREHIYESGLTNPELIAKIDKLGIKKSDEIYADSAEPDRIEEFYQAGYNIFPAEKSVWNGIEYCKRLKWHIWHESTNLLKEIRGYKAKTDKNGHAMDEPVKYNDHALDAARYALFSHYVRYQRGAGGHIRVI